MGTEAYTTNMENLIKLAEQGNADAQYELFVRYFYGEGLPKDYAKALMWIQKAAEQGLINAQLDIAQCYEKGIGVEQDFHFAFYWLEKAAIQGNPNAMTNLGLYYCLGQGCCQNSNLGLWWWEKAADLGNAHAIYNLGISYAEGTIVERNLSKATELFLKAEELGFELASSALANLDDEVDEYDIDDDELEFESNEFTYSIDIAANIYERLKSQEDANCEFYRQLEDFFIKKGKGLQKEDRNGFTGFSEIVYKNEEQAISVLVQFGDEPSVYGIILPTYGAYTRQLFEEGVKNKYLFGLPIFRLQWFEDMDRAFVYFINRKSYLEYDTPEGRIEKDLFGF